MARHAQTHETLDRILDGALASFADQERASLTVRALAARSGVSVGSIYHHFGSLDGVAAALYERCMLRLLDHLVPVFADDPDPEAGCVRFVRAYLEWTRDRRDQALFLHASAYTGPVLASLGALAAAKRTRLEPMERWLMGHVASGAFVRLPPFLYELLILGPIVETARRWLADPDGVDLEVAMELLPARLLGSLRA